MPRRTRLTLGTAAALTGLYVLYALTVTPRIAAPPLEVAAPDPPAALPRQARELAATYLPAHPWAATARYQLRTARADIFAEDWTRADADQSVRFTPFAMIWHTDHAAGGPPLTIVSEAAVITFENSFSATNPNPGRIIGGALEGQVRIHGPDGLAVVGHNFFYEQTALRVWSENPVSFLYGPHQGAARGVQIELIPAEGPHDNSDLGVSGVRSVELRRDVAMQLMLEEDKATRQFVPVNVQCSGSFEFSLQAHTGVFHTNVRVVKPTGETRSDSLQCDLLTLVFEPKEDRSDASPSGSGITQRLEFRRLRAEGDRVVLASQENELNALASEMTYDAQSRRVELRRAEQVEVMQKSSRLRSPWITLVHGEDGRIAAAWCRGPGWLGHRDPHSNRLELAGRWAGMLVKRFDGAAGLDTIELHEQAVVHQPTQQTGLAADFIQLWFDAQSGGSAAPSAAGGWNTGRNRPKFLTATGNAAIDSPRLQVKHTNRLEVFFEPPSSAAPSPPGHAWPQVQAETLPNRQVLFRPGDSAETTPAEAVAGPLSAPDPAAEDGRDSQDPPLEVVSDSIRVRVLSDGGDRPAEVAEIWTEGNVQLRRQHAAGGEPLRITGQSLHVLNRGGNDQVVQVRGEPAHIRQHGMHIEGRQIQLDRAGNRAWVDGAGLLQLPVSHGLDGKPLPASQPLDVWWQETMTFDGRQARFFGNVRAELADSRMRCHEMDVDLTDRLSFTAQQQPQDIAVHKVRCRHGVEFDSYEYAGSTLAEIRRAEFWEFQLDRITGETQAVGPGVMSSWRRGRGKRAALSPPASVEANRPLQPESAEWEYVRVGFAGNAEGNIDRRFMTFHDRVHILYGPVERPLATIDPDELPKDAGHMQCDQLQVQHRQPEEGVQPFIELLAEGNATLEGRGFHALADSISYDESKGSYVLRALGNRKAKIWRETTVGGERSSVESQRIEFVPAKKQLRAVRTTGAQGTE